MLDYAKRLCSITYMTIYISKQEKILRKFCKNKEHGVNPDTSTTHPLSIDDIMTLRKLLDKMTRELEVFGEDLYDD